MKIIEPQSRAHCHHHHHHHLPHKRTNDYKRTRKQESNAKQHAKPVVTGTRRMESYLAWHTNYGQRFAGLFVLGLPSINHAFTVASVAARDGEAGYLEPFFIYLPSPSPLGCSACRFRAARCYPLRCVYLTPSSGSSQKAGGGTIAKASQHKAVFRSQAFRNSKRCPNGQQCKYAESHLLSSSSAVHSRPCP